MTDTTARPARSKPFIPSGTPRQQSTWTRRIERGLLAEARCMRREAARLERLAAKIAADRGAGRPIHEFNLIKVMHSSVCPREANQLADVGPLATDCAALDAMRGLHRERVEHRISPSAPAPIAVASSAARLDPLAVATSIARSASGEDIDWTREPLTERERKTRRAMLEQMLDGVLSSFSITSLVPYDERKNGAQDWREALAAAETADQQWHTEHDRSRLDEAIAAVDAEDGDPAS